MKKVTLYIAQSLDSFVATKDLWVVWLDKFNEGGDGYGYEDFLKSVDTVIQGSVTYNQFKTKHERKENFVFTSKPENYSDEWINFVKVDSVKDFIEWLDEKKSKHIWLVGGPSLVSQFLNEG